MNDKTKRPHPIVGQHLLLFNLLSYEFHCSRGPLFLALMDIFQAVGLILNGHEPVVGGGGADQLTIKL